MKIAGRMAQTLGDATHNFPPVTPRPIRNPIVTVEPSEFDYTSVRIKFSASACLMSHFFKIHRTAIFTYYKYTSFIYSLRLLSQKHACQFIGGTNENSIIIIIIIIIISLWKPELLIDGH